MAPELDLDAYDYPLPPERIAQEPLAEREAARLLVLDRTSGARTHHGVRDLPDLLARGDLLVLNRSRVLRARLRGRKETGGAAEALLLAATADADGCVPALVRCGGRLREGLKLVFERAGSHVDAEIAALGADGAVSLRFSDGPAPWSLGEMPLPPYIRRADADPRDDERYQTVFAREPGSVAAPTAGLHFGDALLARLDAAGIQRAEVVLHVGPGTFRPLQPAQLRAGRLHREAYVLPPETAEAVAAARARGGRVIAVGTTSARVLETRAGDDGCVTAGHGETDLFLQPGSRFRAVDALLTNFHLPRSSLLLLVAAFAGRDPLLAAYADAVERGYRFYSYGDAMWIR